jgi:hypothetical protein
MVKEMGNGELHQTYDLISGAGTGGGTASIKPMIL